MSQNFFFPLQGAGRAGGEGLKTGIFWLNNHPDSHHSQGVWNLPHKFHLYLIVFTFFWKPNFGQIHIFLRPDPRDDFCKVDGATSTDSKQIRIKPVKNEVCEIWNENIVFDANLGESGYRLETRRQGEALGSVAVAESSPRQCRDDSPRLLARQVELSRRGNL